MRGMRLGMPLKRHPQTSAKLLKRGFKAYGLVSFYRRTLNKRLPSLKGKANDVSPSP